MKPLETVAVFGSLVRFSHTIFALPFALMGMVLAAGGVPPLETVGLILVAMVAARSAAMAMNRLADQKIDAENPRTRNRELPAGVLSRRRVWVFLGGAVVLFVVACGLLNRLTLLLSPVVLAVVLSYPYAKRFTSLCHVWLGLALGLSPVGAWVAVRGEFGPDWWAVGLLGAAVVLWTAGFDIIYALLDYEHDRKAGLFSMPARLGKGPALAVSAVFHLGTVGLLFGVGSLAGLGWPWSVGVGVVTGLLAVEHWFVRPWDLSMVGTAFFTVNGCVSVLLMAALFVDRLLVG